MNFHRTRRSPGLPPGQRLMDGKPRFSIDPFTPPPMPLPPLRLTIHMEGEPVGELTESDLEALGPSDFSADVHCATGWSAKDLIWTGVPLHQVVASLGINEASSPFLVAKSTDKLRGHFLTSDALSPDVILATRLNGEALDGRHGGPLRLIAPQLYAYKSIKHLLDLDFNTEQPPKQGMIHLRGRVAHQERHPKLPSWLVRIPYRLITPPLAYLAERSLKRSERSDQDH